MKSAEEGMLRRKCRETKRGAKAVTGKVHLREEKCV